MGGQDKWLYYKCLNPHGAEYILGNLNIFAFSIISQHTDGTGSWTHSSWKQGPVYQYLLISRRKMQSQDISRHGVDLVFLEYSSFRTRRVKMEWIYDILIALLKTILLVSRSEYPWKLGQNDGCWYLGHKRSQGAVWLSCLHSGIHIKVIFTLNQGPGHQQPWYWLSMMNKFLPWRPIVFQDHPSDFKVNQVTRLFEAIKSLRFALL